MDSEIILESILKKSDAIKSRCPTDAMPARLQEVIEHYCDIKGYPAEYLFSSVLTALGTAIGNSHILYTVNGYTAKANVFVAIIGRRGFNKSEPLTDAFRPIEKFQQNLHAKYANEMAIYKALSKQEKEGALPPFFGKPILSDATSEAVALQLAHYLKGSTILFDELAGFIKSFDKYNKGADEQFYLSAWSGKAITKDRVSSESLYIPFPFLSIIGTIQPEVADQVFYGKEESGFFDRWLLCYPERLIKAYPAQTHLDPNITATYDAIIKNLLKFEVGSELESQPTQVRYSTESWEIVLEWIKHNTDIENDPNTSATEGGIRAKMDIYLHRFCLILQLASYAGGETSVRDEISPDTARKAIKIANYYYLQAEKKRIKDRSELLPSKWKEIYDMLPDPTINDQPDFTTAHFVDLAKTFQIPSRTAKDWLKNNHDAQGNKLLLRVKHGVYRKT